ncbi:MAG: hypothetical protein E7247_09870 [Paenibacillaceae bacterium]|nr:hypothetical protein [Paenibacillaceae bacterium]
MEQKIINGQSYAHPFEYIMCDVFECDRGGACGMADASFIRNNPYTAVVATCMYIYANADEEKKEEIKKFLDDARFHFQFDFDTLLSFETNEKEINDGTYTLSYDNGEATIEALEEKFRNICKK